MKRIIAFILLIAAVGLLFAGCGGDENGKNTDSKALVVSDSSVPLKEAALSSADAAAKIQSLSAKKLGLKGEKGDYKFMVSTKGKLISGLDCFEVIASKQTNTNSDGTMHMETAGQYFLTYDGKKIFRRDLDTGECTEITP